jgi:hypothetical protein
MEDVVKEITPVECKYCQSKKTRRYVHYPYSNWQDAIRDTDFQTTPVKWADETITLRTKEPDLSPKIPKHIQKMIGMRGI